MENNTAQQFKSLAVTPEALRAEADALAFEEAPRRFAVFSMNYDEQDGVIVAWGQHFEDGHVVLTGDAAPIRGTFGSLRSALRVCRCGNDAMYVTWVDPEPEPMSDESPVLGLRDVPGAIAGDTLDRSESGSTGPDRADQVAQSRFTDGGLVHDDQ